VSGMAAGFCACSCGCACACSNEYDVTSCDPQGNCTTVHHSCSTCACRGWSTCASMS
jgi:hypothetical protein